MVYGMVRLTWTGVIGNGQQVCFIILIIYFPSYLRLIWDQNRVELARRFFLHTDFTSKVCYRDGHIKLNMNKFLYVI